MPISLIWPNTSAFYQTAAHMWKIIFEGVLDVCRLPLISTVPFIFAGLTKYTLSFEMVVVPKQTFVCLSPGATNESTRCLWCHDSEQGETNKQTNKSCAKKTSVTIIKKKYNWVGDILQKNSRNEVLSIFFIYSWGDGLRNLYQLLLGEQQVTSLHNANTERRFIPT